MADALLADDGLADAPLADDDLVDDDLADDGFVDLVDAAARFEGAEVRLVEVFAPWVPVGSDADDVLVGD